MRNRGKKHWCKPPKGIVRHFEEKDREVVRTICRQTGQKGNPASVFFEDEEVITMLYADYYMDYEPESCFVAEVNGRVVGYELGCKDTRKKKLVLMTKIYPRVCLRILWKLLTLQYRKTDTYRTLWWVISKGWREALPVPLDKYPALKPHIGTMGSVKGSAKQCMSICLNKELRERTVSFEKKRAAVSGHHFCVGRWAIRYSK